MRIPAKLLGLAGLVFLAGCASLSKLATAVSEAAASAAANPDNVPHGEVRGDAFYSSALGVRKHLMVYLPPSYAQDTTRRFPVAFCLHGLSGSETDWLSRAGIEHIADSLFARGVPETIIVLPDGDDGWYVNWADPASYRVCADTARTESVERYCVQHGRYDDYVASDVVTYVASRYRTIDDRAHRGIGGLSMGGYGALIVALKHPETFAAAASHSGVASPMYAGPAEFTPPARYATSVDQLKTGGGGFWSRYLHVFGTDLERWRTNDPARVVERLAGRRGRVPALFIDCGTEDALVGQSRALHWELGRLGITHTYAEWSGAHTWRYWNAHVPESLAWLARRIGG